MTSWADDINNKTEDYDEPLTNNLNTKTEEPLKKTNSYIEYKKNILRFLFASSDEQHLLFRELLTKRLNEYLEGIKNWIPEFKEQNKRLAEEIHLSKVEAITHLTIILKKQMEDYKKGIKPPPNVFTSSIIEKKIFIAELQIEVGVYKLANNERINFFFQT
jgi:hypothetical protein